MTDAVLFEIIESHIALVTLNRPQVHNAVDPDVTRALAASIVRTNADPAIRVCVLTGAGDKAFCAGADLKSIAAGLLADLRTETGGFAGFVSETRIKPWVAAVNGHALGGGCELMLACDLAVADPAARIGLPEVRRGLIASSGGLARLPLRVPRATAFEMIVTGAPITAERAHALGLVNRLSQPGAVVDIAMELARTIAANAPLAVQASLAVARLAGERSEESLFVESQEARSRLRESTDYTEGLQAFAEKRPPEWRGR